MITYFSRSFGWLFGRDWNWNWDRGRNWNLLRLYWGWGWSRATCEDDLSMGNVLPLVSTRGSRLREEINLLTRRGMTGRKAVIGRLVLRINDITIFASLELEHLPL
jgi:hypothetical protein